MKKRTGILIGLILLASGVLRAQMERTIYQVFQVDSVKTIQLDMLGAYELHYWAGSSVLLETNVQIWHASPEILNYFIKEGRYAVDVDTLSPESLRLYTRDRERKPIKNKDRIECVEIATAKLFIPDSFVWTADRKMVTRKEED
ncbi:MAG: hypothetical protein ACK4NS_05020 [Saprospiraceae bacterium]